MKKSILALTFVAFLASCNTSNSTPEQTAPKCDSVCVDTTIKPVDTTVATPVVADSVKVK